jgi:hypothetical protein
MTKAKMISGGIASLKPINGSTKARFEPTLSFNEVVAKYGLNANRFRASLRADEAPRAEINFPNNGKRASITYYARSAICKWVETHLEKLK